MRHVLALITAAASLIAGTPAFGRELCTPDGKFTICQWPQVEGCEILEENHVQRFAMSGGERQVLDAVMRRVERKVFELDDLVAEFGTDVLVDRAIPGQVFAVWGGRAIAGSTSRIAVAFSASDSILELAAIRVPGKYSIRWCRSIE